MSEMTGRRSLRTHVFFVTFIMSLLAGGALIFVVLQPSAEEPPPRSGYMEFYDYGIAHCKPGLWSYALPALKWAVKMDPRQTMGHYQLALAALNGGFPRRALESINEVLERPEHRRRAQESPTFYLLYEMRGHIHSNLGEYGKSRSDFLRALEHRPEDGKLWYYLCWTHLELAELEEGLAAGLKARELGYETYESLFKLGMAYKKLNRLEEAEQSFRDSLSLHRGYTDAYHNLAQTLIKLKRKAEGAKMSEVFQTLAQVDDQLHKLRQRLVTAENIKDEVFRADMETYGNICFQYYKFPELADSMAKLLARDPNNPDYHFKIAYAKFELREEKAADEHYRHTLVLLDLKRRQGIALSAKEMHMEASAMNSLSALLMSARDPKLRRPSEAVLWAEKARILGYPHVDFLAKALMAEGSVQEALKLVTEALEVMQGENPLRPVYEDLRHRLQKSLPEKEMEQPGAVENP